MKKIVSLVASFLFFSPAFSQLKVDSFQLMKDVQILSADKMQGRKTGTAGNRMAQLYIEARFKSIGVLPINNTYEQSFFFQERKKKIMGTNIIGYIKGKSDSLIIISAHYDHLGIARKPINGDSIYNGADDNASGVAGLFAIAKYFSKHEPKHTLIFIAFDGEEEGLQGSFAFVQHPTISLNEVLLNINMDMISHNDKEELYACGTYEYPRLKVYLQNTDSSTSIHLLFGHDRPGLGRDSWIAQSDQFTFYQKQIPFIYFGVEDHKDYHRVSDEFKNINPSFFYNAAETILAATKNFDNANSLLLIKNKIAPKSKWIMKN